MADRSSNRLAVQSIGGREVRLAETRMMLRMARGQHGVLSRQQLIEAGMSAGLIDQRVQEQRLVPVFFGVYAVGHDVLSNRAWWQAALLSGGSGAFLSHSSAAACWGLIEPRNRIEILRGFNRGRPVPGSVLSPNRNLLVVHRSRVMISSDFTMHHGFPVTSVARTILNQAAASTLTQLESLISDADKLEILDWAKLEEVASRGKGWRGVGKLRAIVTNWDPRLSDGKSAMERRFIALCRKYSIPLPSVNVTIGEFEVDCLWREAKLVVELDSRGFHSNLKKFESDRRRDVVLGNAGFEVRRVTHRQLGDADYIVNEVLRRVRP